MKKNVGIAGIGFCVPENIVTNEEFVKNVNTTGDWIYSKIGIRERRIASKEQALSDLAYPAALQALQASGITSQELDLIIVCAINHDRRVPTTSVILQKKLGAEKCAAFDVNVGGCPGSCYSLVIGQQFVENGMYKNVLVVSGEIYSKFIDMTDRNVSVFFGDGVGAAVLRPCKKNTGFLSSLLGADGEWGADSIICEGGSRIPITEEAFANKQLGLTMNNKEVWKFGIEIFPSIVKKVTYAADFQLSDIDWVIPHQANINIIKYGMDKLKLPMSKTHTNIHKFANTGAGSVFIALAEAVQLELIQPGQVLVLASFGAGFSWGAIIIRWCSKEDFEI